MSLYPGNTAYATSYPGAYASGYAYGYTPQAGYYYGYPQQQQQTATYGYGYPQTATQHAYYPAYPQHQPTSADTYTPPTAYVQPSAVDITAPSLQEPYSPPQEPKPDTPSRRRPWYKSRWVATWGILAIAGLSALVVLGRLNWFTQKTGSLLDYFKTPKSQKEMMKNGVEVIKDQLPEVHKMFGTEAGMNKLIDKVTEQVTEKALGKLEPHLAKASSLIGKAETLLTDGRQQLLQEAADAGARALTSEAPTLTLQVAKTLEDRLAPPGTWRRWLARKLFGSKTPKALPTP